MDIGERIGEIEVLPEEPVSWPELEPGEPVPTGEPQPG